MKLSTQRGRPRVAVGLAGAIAGVTAVAAVASTGGNHAGPQGDGTAITPVGYRVTPAGSQTNLGDLPLSLALSPHGDMLLVSDDGQGTQSLQVVDPATSAVTQTLPYSSPQSLFAGLAFSPDGSRAYASGGGDDQIHTYAVSGGRLTEGTPLALPATNPAGTTVNMFPAGLAATADGTRLVVADHLADAASVVNLSTKAITTVAVGHAPVDVAVTPDSTTAYVTNQGADTVSVLDLTSTSPTVSTSITVGTHPNALALDAGHHRLYVADGDSDQVSVVDTSTNKIDRTIDLAPYSGANVGSNPTGLALSSGAGTLYVSNAGNNDVDVVNLESGKVTGSIPTGWYPSAVTVSSSKLYVANAKGLGAGPNTGTGYPDPTSTTPTSPAEYVGSMMVGTLSTIPLPLSASQLTSWTKAVAANDGFGSNHPGVSEPIKHVIYVVQENRTFDQVFGSLGRGNGDAALNLFADESAPNQRALQRRFVTLDNFYADAEVSAQGWNWAVAANSNPYSEALWPADYSGRNAPYPSEESDSAIAPNANPASAYIWDRLASSRVSFRNYGFYVKPDANNQMIATDPVLDTNTDHDYLGFDLNCPDNPDTFMPRSAGCGTPRFTEWKREFDDYVKNGNLPTVEFLRLPNDHTAGTAPGLPTPQAYVADNDLALGRVVDAVSHSRYWKDTAIFVTEDDAQNGPDHVDAHRTISQVISPYTQTGSIDSTFYSTASMLRTVEDLVGIRPLTQFDAYATPMTGAFTAHPHAAGYQAVVPADAGNATNGVNAPMASVSAAQRLDEEDEINMTLFNEAIWQSVKGSRMPAPRHSLWGTVGLPAPN